MNWIGRLSVGAKLILSFCVGSVVTAIVGGMGIYRMAAINQELEGLYKYELIGTTAAMDIAIIVPSIGRDARQMILESHEDRASMAEVEDRINGFVTRLEEALKTLDETTFTEENLNRIATIKTNFPMFMSVVREGMKEAREGNDAAATAKIFESLKVSKPTRETAIELVKAKRDRAERVFNDSAAAYRTARLVMIAFIVVGVVLSVALGLVISRWFTGAVVQVDDISNLVASASQELAAAAEQLSSGAQESASSLEETASSLEEMTATVKQNADNADQANQLANTSRSTAEQGGEVVANAVTAMAEINQASKKIADIITTIDEIAFQTNLLALNAAVEAARAGEQGRGFAVVAGEVRNLAQRSATAAREIKGLIQDSVQKVETGSALVNRSGETLSAIVTSVKKVTDIVAEIAAASREQAAGIDQINKAVAQMDQVTQSNASQTEEMSGTAVALSGQAEHLQAVVSQFNIKKGAPKGDPAVPSSRTASTEAKTAAKRGKPDRKRKTTKPADREMERVGAGALEFSGFEEF